MKIKLFFLALLGLFYFNRFSFAQLPGTFPKLISNNGNIKFGTTYSGGIPGGASRGYGASASFKLPANPKGFNYIPAGTVQIGNIKVPMSTMQGNIGCYGDGYCEPDSFRFNGFPITDLQALFGTSVPIAVSGNQAKNFGPFNGVVVTPHEFTFMTPWYPTVNSFEKTEDMYFTWNADTCNTLGVYIYLRYNAVYNRSLDSLRPKNPIEILKFVPDNGYYKLDSKELAILPDVAKIDIGIQRSKIQVISDAYGHDIDVVIRTGIATVLVLGKNEQKLASNSLNRILTTPKLRLSPNPSHGDFTVSGLPANSHSQLMLYDMNGKVVWSQKTWIDAQGTAGLNLVGLPAGTYQLSAMGGKSVKVVIMN